MGPRWNMIFRWETHGVYSIYTFDIASTVAVTETPTKEMMVQKGVQAIVPYFMAIK